MRAIMKMLLSIALLAGACGEQSRTEFASADLPGVDAAQAANIAADGICIAPGPSHPATLLERLGWAEGWLRVAAADVEDLPDHALDSDGAAWRLPATVGTVVVGVPLPTFLLDEERFTVLTEAAARGADALLGTAEGYPPLISVYPDDSIGFVGNCEFGLYATPFYEWRAAEASEDSPYEDLLELIGADTEAIAGFEEFLYGSEGPAWEDLPPEGRVLHPDDAPAAVLDQLNYLRLTITLPPAWAAVPAVICTNTKDLGWNGCADLTLSAGGAVMGPIHLEAYVEPTSTLEVVLLPPDGDFRRPLLSLQRIDLSAHDISGDRSLHLATAAEARSLEEAEAAADEPGELFTVQAGN